MSFTLGGKVTHQKVNGYDKPNSITLNWSLTIIVIASSLNIKAFHHYIIKSKSTLCLHIQFAVKIGDYLKLTTLFPPSMLPLLHGLCSAERFLKTGKHETELVSVNCPDDL